jgi:xanthine/uracil permease
MVVNQSSSHNANLRALFEALGLGLVTLAILGVIAAAAWFEVAINSSFGGSDLLFDAVVAGAVVVPLGSSLIVSTLWYRKRLRP